MNNLIIVIFVSGIVSFSVSFWFMKFINVKNLKLMDDFFKDWSDYEKKFFNKIKK